MAIYTIYKHDEADLVQAVKLGFSWPAFFFGTFWAAYKLLWLVFSLSLLAVFSMVSIMGMIAGPEAGPPNSELLPLWSLAFSALYGAYGNDWVRIDLERQGYQVMSEVEGDTPRDALERFEGMG
jgi:hypothetical protein